VLQGFLEGGVRMGVGERRLHVVEGLADADSAVPGGVEGGHGRCPALRLHAMQEHGATLGSQHGHGIGRLIEHVVGFGLTAVSSLSMSQTSR
jgi:hypothetical protein